MIVEYDDGTSVSYARRERPEFIFDKSGNIVALTTGVVDPSVQTGQRDRSFTVVQPVAVAAEEETAEEEVPVKEEIAEEGARARALRTRTRRVEH